MSTKLRESCLKALKSIGVTRFKTKSSLGIPYVCFLNDFAGEVAFYNPSYSVRELLLMAEWCREIDRPVIFDIGANNGFVAVHLAQLLNHRLEKIFAFEPVPSTFAQLQYSVDRLALTSSVFPVCCAVSDQAGATQIWFNARESLFAQIRADAANVRAGVTAAICPTVTVDDLVKTLNVRPHLLKIDVEGFEPYVMRGAEALLSQPGQPALCFEWNPLTLGEVNREAIDIGRLLSNYALYYVDDFQGQRRPLLDPISNLSDLDWTCNVFATSRTDANSDRVGRVREAIQVNTRFQQIFG